MGNSKNKHRRPLPQEDVDYLTKQTKFTAKQINGWYKTFQKYSPDGSLTKNALLETYRRFFPESDPEKFCNHMFRMLDVDDSGTVDFKEFVVAINVIMNGSDQEKLDWAFNLYDIDKNGTIADDEMVEIVKAICTMSGIEDDAGNITQFDPNEKAEEIIRKMKFREHGGTISKTDFVAACEQDRELFLFLLPW